MEQERVPRKAERLKRRVMAKFEVGGKTENGIVLNLSEVGLFIQTRHVMKPGTPMTVQISSGSGQAMEVKGKVAYAKKALVAGGMTEPGGMGIELTQPTEDYVKFVAGLKA